MAHATHLARSGAFPRFTATLLTLALLGAAWAEAAFESPEFRFSVTIPGAWALSEEVDLDGDLTVLIGSPGGEVALIVGAGSLDTAFDAEERAAYEREGLDGVLDAIVIALIGPLPGMQVSDRQATHVAGADARRVTFASSELRGSLVALVDEDVLFLLAGVGHVSASELADQAYERMVDSFTRLPRDGQVAVNPLAPGDPLVGRYRGEHFDLVLQGGGGSYTGHVALGDERLDLRASGSAHQLEGSFDSAGTSFAFTAVLDGDTLTFVTDGVRHTLRR